MIVLAVVVWLVRELERMMLAGAVDDRQGATILRCWESIDFPGRCEPAWLRQADIAAGPEPW